MCNAHEFALFLKNEYQGTVTNQYTPENVAEQGKAIAEFCALHSVDKPCTFLKCFPYGTAIDGLITEFSDGSTLHITVAGMEAQAWV
ncbi:hypothetical protein [Vibrio neonatus]|uniref:hypothetical protein n=1 Tax=Vibrio neonatus TaxID=278860 RepID=UPI0021C45486|nr:hypothetical protein [Vibrio neonatus]